MLRTALQAALIKNPEHLSTFNLIFELHTAGTPESGRGPLAGLSDEELRAALRQAIAADDGLALAQLADEYVRRFAGAQPGERVAGVMYTRAVTAAADLEGLRAELLGDGAAGGGAGGGPGGGAGGGAGDPGDGGRVRPGLGPRPAGQGRASTRASAGSGPRSRPPCAACWSPTAARRPCGPPCGCGCPRTPTSAPRRRPSWRP